MDIKYDDLAAEQNKNTKRIDVTVLSGVYIAKSSDDDSGTSANKPCLATAIEDSTKYYTTSLN